MPAKMRLQRYGKKGQPYYHIVIADGRAPRDGRFIEKIGTYNPLTRPADIKIDFDRALYWVKSGAVPTETVEAILKYTGVAYMHHLYKGVKKGAMTEEQAQARFDEWKSAKDAKIEGARKDYLLKGKTADKKKLEAEAKVNETKANELAKKRATAAGIEAKAREEAAEEAEVVVEAKEEVVAEAVVEETAPAAVAEETAPAAVAEETAPAAVAEETAPVAVAEETSSESPAEESAPEASEEAAEEKA
jgi:small subunit ribosomal protein S16